jgi:hypothetical protein
MLLSAAPVKLRYGYDNIMSFEEGVVYTFDNLDFSTNKLLVSARDVVANNDQLLVLTENLYLPTAFETVSSVPPKDYVYSSLIVNNLGAYLYATTPTALSGSSLSFTYDIQAATVFNFYFPPLSSNNVQIYYTVAYEEGTADYYLVCNTSTLTVSGGSILTLKEVDYTFYYILSGSSLSLISISPGTFGYFISNNNDILTFNNVVPTAPNQITIPDTCIFKASRFSNNNSFNQIEAYGESSLVKYVKENNSILIDRESEKTEFNYLLAAPYKTLDTKEETPVLDANLMPLKNYYGPRYIQTIVQESNTPARTYNKIFTGLNQEDGFNKIYLGYTSDVTSYNFTKDTDTYFHIPYGSNGSVPEIISLSSTELIQYGSYPNTTPYRSDRIFKKNAGYKNYSNWGNSSGSFYPLTGSGSIVTNGMYLCSWLSAGATADINPVWVDRFYDPRYINIKNIDSTTINALSSFLAYSTNNCPNVIWDTPSNLTLEPGVLYNYHRIGDKDNNTLVESFSGLTYHFNSWGPVLYNQVTELSAGIISNYTAANSGTNLTLRSSYFIPRNTYGVINTYNSEFTQNKGNTLSFHSFQPDWNKIYGDQIVGNYFNGGIGIFNNLGINTPYFTIGTITDPVTTTNSIIRTFNTNLKQLNYENYTTFLNSTNDQLSAINFIVKAEYDESYYIIDGHSSAKFISTFDPDDLITSKVSLVAFDPTLQNEYILDVALYPDFVTDEKFVIIKTRPTQTSVKYRKFLTTGVLIDTITRNDYNNFAIDLSGNPVFYNSKLQSTVALSGTTNCIDSTGLIFALSSTNTGIDVLTRDGAPVLAITKPDYINCDQDDNIWITYNDTSLAKVTREGKVQWTKQISSNETITNHSGVRTVSFIADNTPRGLVYYGLVLDAKTNYIYKIDSEGSIVSKQAINNIIPFGDCTGFDYQRKYIKPLVPGPSIKLKVVATDSTLIVPTPVYHTLVYSVSGLSPGWHHFAATYDETDIVRLYVDGALVKQVSSSVRPGFSVTGKFSYRIYNYKNNPQLLLGTSNFKTGTLNTWVEQPEKYLYNGYIADVRLYNITLTPSDIKALSKNYQFNQFNDLRWSINVEGRDYIDEIERFFLHRLPGSKSQFYDIKVKNSGIQDPRVRTIVENNLRAAAIKVAPAYTTLRSIIWE